MAAGVDKRQGCIGGIGASDYLKEWHKIDFLMSRTRRRGAEVKWR
jgi:hypothetical protein